MKPSDTPQPSRRAVTTLLASLPALWWLGCETDRGGAARDGALPDGHLDPDGQVGGDGALADASTRADAGADAGGDAEPDAGGAPDAGADAAPPAAEWASGGTAAMVDKARYPNPFVAGGATCALTCAATIGPCHTTSPERVDVSDGWDGLPVNLRLRVVDEDCQPVPDVIVEIWHTNHRGGYSGRINAMCNERDEDLSAQFFRGYQRSDADGQVSFDTCYPGWYRGRVVHIHFRVLRGAYDAADGAAAEIISQLFFSDELNAELFAEHPIYSPFGQPDTQLGDDNVVGRTADIGPYVLDVARMSDGAMLASATLVLRSTAAQGCSL